MTIGIGKGKVPLAFLASLYPDHASIHQPMLLSQGVTPSSSLGTPYTNKGFSQHTRNHHDLKKSSSVLFGTPFEEKTSNHHHHGDLLVDYAPHSSTGSSRKIEVRPTTANYAYGMVSSSFQTPSSVLSPPLTSGEFRRVKEDKQQSTPSSSSSSSSSHKHEKEDKLISFEENELRMQKRSLRTLRKHILSQIELQNEV
jgi:hypothetical protein